VLGNHRLIEERGQCSPALEATLREHESRPHRQRCWQSGGPCWLFAVADTIKPSRARRCRTAGAGRHAGDADRRQPGHGAHHGPEAGIDDARGNLLPQDKLEAIKALQARTARPR
jgi:Cd2+/Zn2+-exporting ATPase